MYNRTTAVSLRYAHPSYLCTPLQRQRSSRSNIRLLLGMCIGCDVLEKVQGRRGWDEG
jgi:hypothetical protein